MDINQIRSIVLVFAAWAVCLAAGFRQDLWNRQMWKRGRSGNVVGETGSHNPSLTMDPIRVTKQKDGVVLQCKAHGSPMPVIYWVYKGSKVIQAEQTSYSNDDGEFENTSHNSKRKMLRIAETKSNLYLNCESMKRLGEYECVAKTLTEMKTRSMNVDMSHFGHIENNDLCFPDFKNQIYMWTSNRVEVENSDVQLFCRATIPAQVTWYDPDNRRIENGDGSKYTILQNGDLLIKRVTWAHNFGLYTCKAGHHQVPVFFYPTSR